MVEKQKWVPRMEWWASVGSQVVVLLVIVAEPTG